MFGVGKMVFVCVFVEIIFLVNFVSFFEVGFVCLCSGGSVGLEDFFGENFWGDGG